MIWFNFVVTQHSVLPTIKVNKKASVKQCGSRGFNVSTFTHQEIQEY
jgi:hypothetical protein